MTTITRERAQEIFLGNGPEPTASEQRELARIALASLEREQVRREHAEWSDKTFGDVGHIGPLKHLSKEVLEAAAEPEDLSEWADMQFLLWDAQRRAGFSDKQITQAMIEKLAVNKKREWPEPKDGEPRLHIKEQPAPVVPEEHYQRLSELYHAQEKRLFKIAQRIKGPAFDKYSHSPSQAIDVLESALFGENEATCRAAMLQGSQPVSNRDELLYAQVKAVADLYALCWQSGEVVTYTPDPEKATIWLNNYSGTCAQEYVKLERLQEALAGNSPVTTDGWINCSERMPDSKTAVLVAREFDRKGDWRMKWATYIPGHPDANDGWIIPGASWKPSHWMPLPEPPQE
ncbi:TPA: dATP/dGTP pyrophosphohydrolase domain-containing protein [Salmonella enterica]